MKRIAIIALLLILTLAAAALAESPDVGDVCPDFELTTVTGESFRLSEQRGKVVFINIWASWCPPCVAEMPEIDALAKAYPDELSVIGVSVDDRMSDVKAFIAEQGFSYPIAMDDANYTVANKLFPTYAVPNSIFIDPNGVVFSIEPGMADYATMEQRFLGAKAHAAE